MKLVTFEKPIWSTLQGEGTLVGTPSVFIRTWGCDFSCEWCDTKGSWKPGSTSEEYRLEDVLWEARKHRLRHAVITGGNPLLQVNELADLLLGLQADWLDREVGDTWREGMHVTIETQGSLFDEAIARHVDLLSLSPKLHDWRGEPVNEWVKTTLSHGGDVQLKVVCTSVEDVGEALSCVQSLALLAEHCVPQHRERLHFILQPESSLGRAGVAMVHSCLTKWYGESAAGYVHPTVRIIPQTHKTALYVR